MILASVKLYHPNATTAPGAKFIDLSSIHEWLFENVGVHAEFRDYVDETFPWHEANRFSYVEFSFAREQDAIMFSLRWS